MITLNPNVAEEIKLELESIPEKYHKPFNSTHEGYAVILEEMDELWDEVKFGEKATIREFEQDTTLCDQPGVIDELAYDEWRLRMRKEAIQVAAMAIRFIQDLT